MIPSTGVVCDQGRALMLLAKVRLAQVLRLLLQLLCSCNHRASRSIDISMAVTSAARAELIGISSLFIYRTYFRPNATGDVIVRVSHYFICFWAVWMGCWATIAQTQQLNAGDINLGWERLSRRES
ncbi:hypothetical protein EDB19DRAFT_2027898 [Suillus lakei]|nr:hypothetical protein EDB19DRAFT_2027898 [Suillus lakei]